MTSHAYKFQAFVTLIPQQLDRAGAADVSVAVAEPAVPSPLPPGGVRRMAVRGEHHDTHEAQFFSALVANYGECADWIGANHAVVTIRLQGDEPADYFSAGDHFSLWLGHDIADGIVTRRLII
jgi:hypothetical protein